jgi:hypothetical protein
MTKEKTLETREELRDKLGKIVEISRDIEDLLIDAPLVEGNHRRTLKPRSEEYIVHSNSQPFCQSTIVSHYRHSDGKLYSITIEELDI